MQIEALLMGTLQPRPSEHFRDAASDQNVA